MPALLELQQDFLAAILDAGPLPAGLTDARGFGIYRNNALANRVGALRATYAVVERLVGPEFFGFMAGAYAAENPSLSANLEEYGHDFGDFVATFAPAASLPYLADVARFEAAIDALLIAPDEAPGQRPTADVDAMAFGRVTLDPASRLFASPYPVHRIWLSNQPGADEADIVSLDEPGTRVLLRRDAFAVTIEPLDEAEFEILSQIAADGLSPRTRTTEASDADGARRAVLARRCAQGLFRILPPITATGIPPL